MTRQQAIRESVPEQEFDITDNADLAADLLRFGPIRDSSFFSKLKLSFKKGVDQYAVTLAGIDRAMKIYQMLVDQNLASELLPGDITRLPEDMRSELMLKISSYAHQTAVKMIIPGSDKLRYNEEVSLKSLRPILGFGKHNGRVTSPIISTSGAVMNSEEVMLVCQYLKF